MLISESIARGKWRRWSFIVAVLAAVCVVAGCGGGGSTLPVAGGGGGGGGGGAPTVIPPPACVLGSNPAITISLVASRTSGVAPLAVFFDASATVSTVFPTQAMHNLGFQWNFGESTGPGIATWGVGARPGASRNEATGPLAAHVFETPGTYNVCVTVTDGTTTVDGVAVITVTDPQVAFTAPTGTTLCFSASGAAPGCPPGGTGVAQSDFRVALAMAAPNTRLLFARGEVFVAGASGIPQLNSTGPGLIGAFGTGAPPKILQQPGNTRLFLTSGTTSISDWRVMDLELDGNFDVLPTAVQGGAGGGSQLTLLRLSIHDTDTGIELAGPSPGGHLLWDQVAIVDCNIQNLADGGLPGPPITFGGGNGMFLMASQLALLGNFVNDTTRAEHVVRVQYGDRVVIQSNDLGLPNTTKHTLTVRAANRGTFNTPNTTQKVVITDNLIRGGLASQPVSIQPSGATSDELIMDVIVDGNFVRGGPSAQQAFVTAATEVTYRNNVIDLSGATSFNCMTFQQLGVEGPHSGIRVFNNTCFSNTTGAGAAFALRVVFLDATSSNVTVANNLGYAPNMTGGFSVLLFNAGSTGVTGGSGTLGNATDPLTTNPNFVNAGGASISDYAVLGGSFAIGSGTAVPVFTDIFRNARPLGGTFDSGAAEQ